MINSNVEISVKQEKQIIIISSQLTPHRCICFHVSLIFKFSELLKLCKYSHECWDVDHLNWKRMELVQYVHYMMTDSSPIAFKTKYTKFQYSEKKKLPESR